MKTISIAALQKPNTNETSYQWITKLKAFMKLRHFY